MDRRGRTELGKEMVHRQANEQMKSKNGQVGECRQKGKQFMDRKTNTA
jgi:hypothetical protein